MALETFNLTPQSTLFVFRHTQQDEAATGTDDGDDDWTLLAHLKNSIF